MLPIFHSSVKMYFHLWDGSSPVQPDKAKLHFKMTPKGLSDSIGQKKDLGLSDKNTNVLIHCSGMPVLF